MPKIKIKTSSTASVTPGNGTLEQGELAVNLADSRIWVGNASNNPVLIGDSLGRQDANAVTITGGTINSTAVSTTSANFSALGLPAERLWYDEGSNAAPFVGNWNNATVTTMAEFGGLGSVTAHGWAGGAANYTLSLGGLPPHTEIRYEVFWHMVDSLDNETSQLFITNTAGTEVNQLTFTKVSGSPPVASSVASGVTTSWQGNRWYGTAPWGGSGRVLENNGANGYWDINSGWFAHTASTISIRHLLGADQAQSDEAMYLSHVKLWIRGGTNTFTSIATSASVDTSASALSTQNALRQYADNNILGLVKNVFVYTGNTTYTKTGTDVRRIRVICVGGGGGGRGYGESGGAGGYAERTLDAASITSVSITIGGGGGGGGYFGYSPQGGTTSFGGYVSASGGFGANNHGSHIGGHGGIGSGGDINAYGGGGMGHNNGRNNPTNSAVGRGGSSFYGGSRNSHHSASRPGDHGAPGAGGTGSVGDAGGAGSDGRAGICIVYELR